MTSSLDYVRICFKARHPYMQIFNISTDGAVPGLWKRALTIPIPTTNPSNSLDDRKPISLSLIPCKVLERVIAKELWKEFTPKLSPIRKHQKLIHSLLPG